MSPSDILYAVYTSLIGGAIGYIFFFLKQHRQQLEKRLTDVEQQLTNRITEGQARTLVQDLQRPLDVKADQLQEDIKEVRDDMKYIRGKIDRIAEKL